MIEAVNTCMAFCGADVFLYVLLRCLHVAFTELEACNNTARSNIVISCSGKAL